VCLVSFANRPGETFCLVGVAKEISLHPRSVGSASIHCYRVIRKTSVSGLEINLELAHKTPVDDIPQAMCAFHGRVLIGVGKYLRLYDLGQKKLLRKCENKVFIISSIFMLFSFTNNRFSI